MPKTLAFLLFAFCWPMALQAGPQTAVFKQAQGDVRVLRGDKVLKVKAGFIVREGDEIQCRSKSGRVILFSNAGHEIRLKGKTQIKLKKFTKGSDGHQTLIELLQGKIWMAVAKLRTSRSSFEVEAGGVVCGVRGTKFGGEFDPKERKGRYSNHEGKVDLIDQKKIPMGIPLRHYCKFKDGVYTDTKPMDRQDLEEFAWKAPATR